ncbi:MAG: anti-sigma regulatory factor [Verrucomicrobiaceae bacterium]|nr:MAG: anti-sigma regulatory factor [Verrucomicrobiaceae bacterium]
MPTLLRSEKLEVSEEQHIVTVRQAVRRLAVEIKLSLVDQTKIITAASELARNLLIYGGGGEVILELLREGARQGVRVHFVDEGPGIENIELALRDGYTSGGGMGLGLGGAKRLVNEFELVSTPGQGTHITITRWK